jgi:hypothetical protein
MQCNACVHVRLLMVDVVMGCTCTCVSVAIDLFHETDRFHFKPGYKNRRINITLLFGKRGTGYLEKNKK